MRKRIIAVAAGLLLLAGCFLWLVARRQAQEQRLANAQLGLQTLARLQHAYRQRAGAYAPDLSSLLKTSGHENEFRRLLPQVLDMDTLVFSGGKDSFLIEASALDRDRTRIKVRSSP